ncbi:MAG: hypothetical protein VYE68_13910 [Acidobacteriota bacterium]|nr:hypothetical protein [Acidobacteriota bacterium]
MSNDILPNDDGFWPAMRWSDDDWADVLPPDLAQRVRVYATERGLDVRVAVMSLLSTGLDQRVQRQAGGRKRWAGVTTRDRRAHATRAAQARWGTPAETPDG